MPLIAEGELLSFAVGHRVSVVLQTLNEYQSEIYSIRLYRRVSLAMHRTPEHKQSAGAKFACVVSGK